MTRRTVNSELKNSYKWIGNRTEMLRICLKVSKVSKYVKYIYKVPT